MTKKLPRALVLCLLGLASRPLEAQSGPDNDADAAPGYTNSVFHHDAFDSVNLYNGQLTVPIALGPSYPIGPKLRFQLSLVYNSRVDDYGAPLPGQQQPSFVFKPLAGNSSLPIGWELSLGAIKPCRHGITSAQCYFAPDGSQHMFPTTRGNGRVTGDGSAFFLKGSGPYEMWDGDGNHYVFDKQAAGFDDPLSGGFTHDFGRGRDGWYLGSLTDPHGNGYSVTYWTGSHPRWTYPPSGCDAGTTSLMQMRAPTGTGGWVPKDIALPSGKAIHIERGHNGSVDGMVLSADISGSRRRRFHDADLESRLRHAGSRLRALVRDRHGAGESSALEGASPSFRSRRDAEIRVHAVEPADPNGPADGRNHRILLWRLHVLPRASRRRRAELPGPAAAAGIVHHGLADRILLRSFGGRGRTADRRHGLVHRGRTRPAGWTRNSEC